LWRVAWPEPPKPARRRRLADLVDTVRVEGDVILDLRHRFKWGLISPQRIEGAIPASRGAIDGAAAALFAAGVAARTRGKVLWCLTRPDLFAPALAQAGLMPDRVIYVEAGDEKSVLICFEEGLRHGGLGAVVAEVAQLSMTVSRRLQLAAEGSGTIGIAIRRWRRPAEAADFGQPTASVTRWRVSALPATPLPVPGVGRPRWQLIDPVPRRGKCRFRSGGL
jgi:protein ImuA